MIRFLQTQGPLKKIILSAMLLVICGAMVMSLGWGGISDSLGVGGPGQGVVANVAGDPVTTIDVQREARQMLRQQFPQGGAQTEVHDSEAQSLQGLRTPARVSAEVPALPHLLPAALARRLHPRRDQGELVSRTTGQELRECR